MLKTKQSKTKLDHEIAFIKQQFHSNIKIQKRYVKKGKTWARRHQEISGKLQNTVSEMKAILEAAIYPIQFIIHYNTTLIILDIKNNQVSPGIKEFSMPPHYLQIKI